MKIERRDHEESDFPMELSATVRRALTGAG
jgi:hypothetical protein